MRVFGGAVEFDGEAGAGAGAGRVVAGVGEERRLCVGVVLKGLKGSGLAGWMMRRCEEAGLRLVLVTDWARHEGLVRSCRNLLVWGRKVPREVTREAGRNVLFLESSLIDQAAGVFVDRGGLFAESNLCRRETWREDYPAVDLARVARECFGWRLFGGGRARGPVLVALQRPRDAAVQDFFPLGGGEGNKVRAMLGLLREHLPRGRTVLIRPHPRERMQFETGGIWRDDWSMDVEGSFAERLPQCSALVTVNSTCASEAALLGVPTATLGKGAFSGSGVTLECDADARRLAGLWAWRPDLEACRRYAAAVRGRHFLGYEAGGEGCAEFEGWLRGAVDGG